jgi:hypothetical protein
MFLSDDDHVRRHEMKYFRILYFTISVLFDRYLPVLVNCYSWKEENYGPAKEKEGWGIKYSYELYYLYNAPVVVKTVKMGRFK